MIINRIQLYGHDYLQALSMCFALKWKINIRSATILIPLLLEHKKQGRNISVGETT